MYLKEGIRYPRFSWRKLTRRENAGLAGKLARMRSMIMRRRLAALLATASMR
jgi:hypothetical protein